MRSLRNYIPYLLLALLASLLPAIAVYFPLASVSKSQGDAYMALLLVPVGFIFAYFASVALSTLLFLMPRAAGNKRRVYQGLMLLILLIPFILMSINMQYLLAAFVFSCLLCLISWALSKILPK